MRSARRRRDDALVGRMLEKRRSRIAASSGVADTVYLLRALVADFSGLVDLSAEAGRLEEMSRRPDVKQSLERERDFDDGEARMLGEMFQLEGQLGDDGRRSLALMTLRDRLSTLSRKAASEADAPERRQARRVLRSIGAGASQDREYLALLERYRLPGR